MNLPDFLKILNKEDYFKRISQLADKLDVKIYVVGGYVRDIILDRKRDEIDFLVLGDGPHFATKLANEFGIKNISTFKNFGTAHFKYREIDFEFVGARKESYNKDSRNPIVEVGTFDDDINRRDLTINTLALSLNKEDYGSLLDKFNGVTDLESEIIKTPLDPKITFDDDPLRIMRAFRFASQLQFDVDENIMTAASEMAERLKIVSQERITEEFYKIMASPRPSIGLKLLYNSKVMEVIFPEIAKLGGVDQRKDFHHKDVFLHTCLVIDNLAAVTDNLWLRFAGLFHDIAKPQTKRFIEDIGWSFHGHEEMGARMMKSIFKRMKFPLSQLDYIQKLIRLHLRPIALVDDEVTDSAIRRMIVTIDDDLEDLITLCRADITSKNQNKVAQYLSNYEKVMQKVREVKEKDKLRAFQSPVRGETIMEVCKIPPGQKVGEIKNAIEEAILEGIIPNEYDDAYNFMLKIKDDILSNP